ncbi:MAG: hypothetical protein K1X61_01480 [Chitinophagales bacterium]|nr:hypothetical protein [Chitinophagales bacterium]
MTIHEIKLQLMTATNPVAKALHKNDHFKVLAIGFRKGMALKEHQAHHPSKLIVLEGKVIYIDADTNAAMGQYDEMEIPVNKTHSVTALEDSVCLLTQG